MVMKNLDPQKVEEYQIILRKNPRSMVFAPLADAYRKMGLLEEALELTTKGVQYNPDYVSGWVTHAIILFDFKKYEPAIEASAKAHQKQPDNILAVKLMGLCHAATLNHQSALQAFKKLLFLKPNDQTAQDFVKKWEFLEHLPSSPSQILELERDEGWIKKLSKEQSLHLIDSFINRSEYQLAGDVLKLSKIRWQEDKEFIEREKIVTQETSHQNPELQVLATKREILNNWLRRIEDLKRLTP